MDFYGNFGGLVLVTIDTLPLLGIKWGDHIYTLYDIVTDEATRSAILGLINTLVFVQLTAWGYDTVKDVVDRINSVMCGGGYVGRYRD